VVSQVAVEAAAGNMTHLLRLAKPPPIINALVGTIDAASFNIVYF
jgi:hypothetical protein